MPKVKHFVVTVSDIIVRNNEIILRTNNCILYFKPIDSTLMNALYFFKNQIDCSCPIYMYDVDKHNKKIDTLEPIYEGRIKKYAIVKSFKIRPKHIALYCKYENLENIAATQRLTKEETGMSLSLREHLL